MKKAGNARDRDNSAAKAGGEEGVNAGKGQTSVILSTIK